MSEPIQLQTVQEETTRNLTKSLQEWTNLLQQYTQRLQTIRVKKHTGQDQVELKEKLELLYSEIGIHDEDMEEYNQNTNSLLEILEEKQSKDLRANLQNLFKDWEGLKREIELTISNLDECEILEEFSNEDERLEARRMQLDQLEKTEGNVMTEWINRVENTLTELDEAVAEAQTYCEFPQHPFDLQDYLVQFQEMFSKVSTRLDLVKNQKLHGHHLVGTDQVQKKTHKDVILADVGDISQKEGLLQTNLTTAHTMYEILQDRLTIGSNTARHVHESATEWQALLNMYNDRLNVIDTCHEKGQNDTHKTIELLRGLFSDISSHQEKLDTFKEDTELLIETLNNEQADKANTARQFFFKNWNFTWNNIKERINVMEMKIRDDLAANEKMAAEWGISSKFIDNWLTKAESDIRLHVKTRNLECQVPKEMADTYHLRAEKLHISETTPRELVQRLENEGKELNKQIEHYLQVAAEGTIKGLEELIDYQGRKMKLDNELLNVSLLLDEIDAEVAEVEVVEDKLKSWWEVLRAITRSFEKVDLLTDKEEAMRLVVALIAETERKSPEIEKFVTSSSETLTQTPFFKKSTSALHDDVLHFPVKWITSLKLLQDAKLGVEKSIDKEHDIMKEWNDRVVVTENILAMDDEIAMYFEAPVDQDDFENYLSKFKELELRILERTPKIDESIEKGLAISEIVSLDNKGQIKNDIDSFTTRKALLHENLITVRENVVKLVEKKTKQREYEKEFNFDLAKWQRALEEWTSTLNECTIEKTSTLMGTKTVISTLENLSNEINSQDNTLEEFSQHAKELLSALDAERSSQGNVELNLFMREYKNLEEKIKERLTVFQNSLNLHLNHTQRNESAIIEEWTANVIKILAWLKDAEKECMTYSVFLEDRFDINKLIANFEGFVGKTYAKIEYIKEQKDYGLELVVKLKEQENKDKVSNDIITIEKGEKLLMLALSSTKVFIDNLQLRIVNMKETERNLEESLVEWNTILHGYLVRYDDINLKYDEEIDDVATTVMLIKELLSYFNGREEQLRMYDLTTQALLPNIDSEAEKKLTIGIQTFFSNWKLRFNNYTKRLQGLELKSKKELNKEEKALTEWLSLSSQIEKWLDKSEDELNIYLLSDLQNTNEEEAMAFHKLDNNNFYLSENIDKKMVKRLSSEEMVVDEQLKRCSSFLTDGKINMPENVTFLTNTINKLMERKSILEVKLNHAKVLLNEMFTQVSVDNTTKTTFSEYEKYLSEKKAELEDVKITTDYNSVILTIEVMALDASKRSNEIESFLSTAKNSLSKNEYRKLESSHLQQKLEAFLVEWKEYEESLKWEQKRFEEKVRMMVIEDEFVVVVDDAYDEVYAANNDFDKYFANVEAENEEKLNTDLADWMKILQHNNETLASCKINKDSTMEKTQLGISTLETLVFEIDSKEQELEAFERTSQDLLQTMLENKVAGLNMTLKNFFKKWNQCTDTANERLNGLRLHYAQFKHNDAAKEDEIKLLLESWNQYLNAKKEHFVRINQTGELYVKVQDLKTLITELNLKADDVESFVRYNSLYVTLKPQLDQFKEQWDKFMEDVLRTDEKLTIELQEELSNEDRHMKEWLQKRNMTEKLLKVSGDIRSYCEEPKNILDYDSYFNTFKELESVVSDCGRAVEDTIKMGNDKVETKLKKKENINSVKIDIENFMEQIQARLQSLAEARLMISQLLDKQRKQQENESEVMNNLHKWQQVLDAHMETLKKCDVDRVVTLGDTEKIMDLLEAMLGKMNGSDNDIIQFDTSSQELFSTLDLATAASLNMKLQLFFKTWNYCKDKAMERLNGLKNESAIIEEWTANVIRILAWLKDAEKECMTYSVFLEDSFDINKLIANFEGFVGKIYAKIEYIKEQKDHGTELVPKMKEQENKDKASNNIITIEKGEKLLMLALSSTKVFIDNLHLRIVNMKETERNLEESLVEWNTILHGYLVRYDDINLKYDEEIDDVATTVMLIKELLSDINGREEQLRMYDLTTQALLPNIDSEAEKRLSIGIQTFFSNWKLWFNNYTKRLQGLELKSKKELNKEEKALTEWLSLTSQIEKWLDKSEDELNIYLLSDLQNTNEEEAMTFHKLDNNNFYLSENIDKKLVKRLSSEKMIVDEQLKRCSSFLTDGKINMPENVTFLTNTINKFMERKSMIELKLNHAKVLLNEMFTQVSVDNTTKATFSEYEKYLSEKKVELEDLKVTTDYNSAILTIDVMLQDASKRSNEMESFLATATNSLSKNEYHKLESSHLQQKLEAFLVEWKEYEESLKWEQKRFEEKVRMMVIEDELLVVVDDAYDEVYAANDDFDKYFANVEAENEEKLNTDLADWMKILQCNNETLASCKINKDSTMEETQLGLSTLETLVFEIDSKEQELEAFERTSQDLLQTMLENKVAGLNMTLKNFFKKWNQCTDTANERLNGLRLHYAQFKHNDAAKEDEIKLLLESWNQYLNAKKEHFVRINQTGELYVKVQDLKTLITELNLKADDVESFVRYNSLYVTLKPQLDQFKEQWDKFMEDVLRTDEKLTIELQEELSNEDRHMKEWLQKRNMTEKLLKVSGDIRSYCEEPKNILDYDSYFNTFKELESVVSDCGRAVEDTIKMGNDKVETKLKKKENINSVKIDIENFMEQIQARLQSLAEARLMISQLLDKQRKQQENESEVMNNLHKWQQVLDAHMETLKKCDVDRVVTLGDTEKIMDLLEAMLGKMNGSDNDIIQFDTSSQELFSTLDLATAASLNMKLQLFFKTWNYCKDKAMERLNGLKNESAIIEEWTANVIRILAWLKDAEKECMTYSVFLEDSFDINKLIANFEGFVGKIYAKIEYIKEQKDHGTELVAKMKEQENKDKVSNDIITIEKGEKLLMLALSSTKVFIDNLHLRIVNMKETERNLEESLVEWNTILHGYLVRYDDINLKYDEEIDDVATTVMLIKELLSDINGRKEQLRMYDLTTQALLPNIDSEAEKKLTIGIQTFFSNWKLRFNNYTKRLQGLELKSKKELNKEEKALTEWLSLSSQIEKWLDKSEDELNIYLLSDLQNTNEEEATAFHKLDNNNFYLSENIDKKMVKRLSSEEMVVDEQLKRCSSFLTDGKINMLENVTFLTNTINKFIEQKSMIDIKLTHAKVLLDEMFKQVFVDNATKATFSEYEKYLSVKKTELEDLKDTTDYNSAILTIDVMSQDASKRSNEMESFLATATNSLSKNEYHKLESSHLQQKLEAFLVEWKEYEESLKWEQKRFEEKVRMMVIEDELLVVVDDAYMEVYAANDDFDKYFANVEAENEEKLNTDLADWMKILQCNNETLASCKINKDSTMEQIQLGISTLETLVFEIDSKEQELEAFERTSQDLLQTMLENKVAGLNMMLKNFFKKWNQCTDTANERLNGLRLHYAQFKHNDEAKEDEIKLLLESWNKYLNAKKEHFVRINQTGELYVKVQDLKTLITELNLKADDVESFARCNSLYVTLKPQLDQFKEQWDKFMEDVLRTDEKLTIELQEELSNEDRHMKEWLQKCNMTEKLLKVSGDIRSYCEEPKNILDYDSYFNTFKELESVVSDCGRAVEDTIKMGNDKVETKLKKKKNINNVKNDIENFMEQIQARLQSLAEARLMISQLLDKQRKQQENESEVMNNLHKWQQVLDAHMETLKKCDVDGVVTLGDTEKIMDLLEAMLGKMNGSDNDIIQFDTSSQELFSTLDLATAASLNMKLQLFLKTWNYCKDKAMERLNGLRIHISQELKNEDHLMAEWNSAVERIMHWFHEVEMEASAATTENVCEKVHTKSDYIRELIGHREHLIDSALVQREDNVHKIQVDISSIRQREDALLRIVDNSRSLLHNMRRQEEEDESKVMSDWQSLTQQIFDWLETAEGELLEYIREDNLSTISDEEKVYFHLTTFNYHISERVGRKLVERLAEEGRSIDQKWEQGTLLVDNGNLNSAENCQRIHKGVLNYTERKRILTNKLNQANILLDELSAQHVKNEDIEKTLSHWNDILKDKQDGLEELNRSSGKINANMKATLQQIESLFAEVTSKSEDASSFASAACEVLTSNKYERQRCDDLHEQLQNLLVQWNLLKKNLQDSKDRWERNIKMEIEHEDLILNEWGAKVVITHELLSACEEISIYCQFPTTMEDFDSYLNRFDGLQSRISLCGDQVDEIVDRGTGLLKKQLKIEENKERVQKDISVFIHKKTLFLRDLITANKIVLQLVEHRRIQKENEESFGQAMEEWLTIIAVNNQTLDKCDIMEILTILQTETSIKLLEDLLTEIENHGLRLTGVKDEMHHLLETLETENVTSLRVQFSSLLQKWDRCKEKTKERLAGLKLQLSQLYKIEKNTMEEWKLTFGQTVTWLEDMEKESLSYCTLPQERKDMAAFLSNFQIASIKADAKEEQVQDVKEYGVNLLETNRIQITENRQQVDSDITALDEKLVAAQQSFAKAKKLIQKRSKVEKETEQEAMEEWRKVSRRIATWLETTERELETDVEGDIEYLEKGYHFIDRVAREGVDIVEQLKEVSFIADNKDVRTVELREEVLRDIQVYTQRKFSIDKRTIEAKALLAAVVVEKNSLDEMMETISQWRNFLHTETTDYHNELNKSENDANITMKNIGMISLELKTKREEFDLMMSSSKKRLSVHRYSSVMAESVQNEFQQVAGEWKRLVEAVQQSKESLGQRVENEARHEECMMLKWEEKTQVLEDILVCIEEVHQYVEAPGTIVDFGDFISKFEQVEATLQYHEDDVLQHTDQGTELHVSKLKVQENKVKIENAVGVFMQRQSSAKETVVIAKRMIEDMMEKRRFQKETKERIREHLSTWQSTLDDCNETLGRCNLQEIPDISNAQKCIDILEVFVSEMERKNVKVEEFDTWSDQQMGTLEPDQVSSLTNEVKMFVCRWKRCSDKAAERLSGFKMQLAQMERAERNLMVEWTGVVDKTMSWFKETEELIQHNEKVNDLHLFLLKFDEVDEQVKVKVGYIKEQRQQGDLLVDTGKLQLKEHKTKVVDDIALMGKRLNFLLESMSSNRIRAEEIRDRLSSDKDHRDRMFTNWQALLDGYVGRFIEYNSMYDKGDNDIHTTITLLQKLLLEVKAQDTELDLFNESSEQSRHFSGEADKALKNLFYKNWHFSKNIIVERLKSFEEKVHEERENEGRAMSEWFTLSTQISSWLNKAEKDMGFYIRDDVSTLSDRDVIMYHETEKSFHISEAVEKELVEKLSEEEMLMSNKIHQGESLVSEGSRLKLKENEESIQKDIAEYTERKRLINEKLSYAKKLIRDVNYQATKDDRLKEQLRGWMKCLNEKNKQLNDIGVESLDAALSRIRVILENLRGESNEVDLFVQASEDHLSFNKFNRTGSDLIQKELSFFYKEWKKLEDAANVLEKSVLSKMQSRKETEEGVMLEWHAHVRDVIELWLQKYERETQDLVNLPQRMDHIEHFATELEKLMSRFSEKEGDIDEKMKHSNHLVDSNKLMLSRNKQEIRNFITDFTNRKLALNRKMLVAQKWLTSSRDRLRNANTEELSAWFSDANAVKDTLRAYESIGREEIVKTVKEAEFALQRQKLLVAELEAHQNTIDDLLRRGKDFIGDKRYSQSKQNEVSHGMKITEQRWEALKNRTMDVQMGYEKIIVSLKMSSEEKVSSLLARVNSFNDWLVFARQQLLTGSLSETFAEHIQREASLRRLSADLDARSQECRYLLNIQTELILEKLGVFSDQDQQLSEALQKLKIDWDSLIQTIENDFKTLYDSVSRLLDSLRVQIQESIDLVQSNLQLVVVNESEDRKTMKNAALKLLELNQELGKLKGNVSKLRQQISTLKDVDVFADKSEEKELLRKSTEDLLSRYKNCIREADQVTNGFRLSIVDYFRRECEGTKRKLEEHGCNLPIYNADEEDLNVLKNFLIKNQHVMEEVKTEQFLVDDIELFADEISKSNVLMIEDQVTVAEIINAVLMAFDQLKSQCKEKTDRVYAVGVHIFNHHLHRLTEEIGRVKTEANKKMKQSSDLKEFSQAIDTLLVSQKLNEHVIELSGQTALVTEQINQWVELHLIEHGDADKLKEKGTSCVTESITVSKDVENLIKIVEDEIRAIGLKRVDGFWAWLPTIQKRSEELHKIGSNFDAVVNQTQEMKLIQTQTIDMSFSALLEPYKSITILEFLAENEKTNLMSASNEWMAIKTWVDRRVEIMNQSKQLWDDFKSQKLDLVEYLRDVEHELEVVIGADLNNPNTIELKTSRCLSVTKDMDAHKDDIRRFTDTANGLIKLLTNADQKIDCENTLPTSIRTQVAEILDSWNTLVRKSIELRSKLHVCGRQFESCDSLYNEVRDWIDGCNQLFSRFIDDASGEDIDNVRVELETMQSEEDFYRKKIQDLNDLDEELSREGEVRPIYSLPGRVELLNKDFADTIAKIDAFKKFPGKVKILSRRARGGTTKLTRNLTARLEGS